MRDKMTLEEEMKQSREELSQVKKANEVLSCVWLSIESHERTFHCKSENPFIRRIDQQTTNIRSNKG